MTDISSDIIEKLSSMEEQEILASENDGRYFYALSPERENIISWYPFRKEDAVLQLGAEYGAFNALSARTSRWDVYDPDDSSADIAGKRAEKSGAGVKFRKELPSGKYDIIIDFNGTEGALKCLKDDGTLIIIRDNAGSLKYLTGSEREEGRCRASLEELLSLREKLGFSFEKLYFPLPNASFARDIKSREMPPVKGDFRSVSESFTGERYALCDEQAIFDRLSEDPGTAAGFYPSYLLILSRKERKLPDYIRFNTERKPEYAIRTSVYKGEKAVKTALSPLSDAHIESFRNKYELLSGTLPEKISVLRPVISENEEGRTEASFDFVKGKSLGKLLSERIRDGRAPKELKEYLNVLTGDEHVSCHNLDILFDNCMLTEGRYTLIDYEWTDEKGYERDFVRYRILRYFYEDNSESLYAYDSLSSYLRSFGFTDSEIARFDEAEEDFQLSVHGSAKGSFRARYLKKAKSISEIRESERLLEVSEDRIHRLKDEVEELKETLSKEREVERLSQQHIRNIENINKARDAEIASREAELLYLRKHEGVLSRVKRSVIRKIDRFAPAGSGRRLLIKYAKGTLRHPGTYFRRYFTKEGHNFIKGDFAIKGEFSEGGILTIPKTASPLVSIVIPAYNQVQYTYACIRSIIENTDFAETPYEVILADDASDDATKDIANWIRNLKIARTGGNLGFLRNCNNAAKEAKGEYIFFLNNDTKVTAGWLRSLVSLMERDESVGMCGSKLIYPDGRLQEAGGIIWSDASGWNYGRLDDPEKYLYNYVKEVDYISGAAILIRHSLWNETGGFDDRFAPAYCEDSDLAFEVRRHGKRVVYQPDSVVIHFEGVSNGTDVAGTGLKRYQAVNQEKFKEKWAEVLKDQQKNTGDPNPFTARERSSGKKTVLVIDHYVPQRDRDAGSKTTFQYLKMFTEKGFNVKFLPDNFLRDEPYTHELQQMGIEVLYGDEIREGIFDWIEKNKGFISIAYLNRPHIAVKYIDFLKKNTKIKCIFYGHDLHYLRIKREYELTGDIRKRRESEYWRSIEFHVMEQSDMVYYPSQDEIDDIHARRPEIPAKAITAYIYDDPVKADYGKREDLLFVGGFRHPPNADGVKWFASSVWPLIRKELPDARFLIAGSHPTEEIEALNGKDGTEVLGFVSDEELSELYKSAKLTVVPLRYGAGVKGKVVEALSEGSVIVTTSVGAEGIPEAETVMAVADTPSSFAEKVVSLYNDSEKLKLMSAAEPEFIKKHYSTAAAWAVIERDFA